MVCKDKILTALPLCYTLIIRIISTIQALAFFLIFC